MTTSGPGTDEIHLHKKEKAGNEDLLEFAATQTLLKEVAKRPKTVPLNHPMIKAARSLGICFGD